MDIPDHMVKGGTAAVVNEYRGWKRTRTEKFKLEWVITAHIVPPVRGDYMINYQVVFDQKNKRFIVEGDFEQNAVPILIAADHPKRKEFIDLFLHKEDIERGIAYLQCISVDKNAILNEALFVAGLNNCMKCFKFSKARSKLDKKEVFKNVEEILNEFIKFEIMRDKHFDHDESGMIQATAFLLISREEDHVFGGPPSVVWNKSILNYYTEGQRLQTIMQYVWKYLCNKIDCVGEEIKNSFEGIAKEELLKKYPAPQIVLAAPNTDREL